MEGSQKLSIEEANAPVLEHQGWGESIARAVARAWNMDWQLDGLDGAAMEAMIFCARRYDPSRGVPFRGYARKRIHEAATDAAKKSRGWRKSSTATEQRAREISAELFNMFPELRTGSLSISDEEGGEEGEDARGAVRNLLIGATLVATRQGLSSASPEELVDYRKMLTNIAVLEMVHQFLLWEVYWEGNSMRTVATDWEVDELSVIREHKSIVTFLQKGFDSRGVPTTKLKVRPALREVSLKLKKKKGGSPFAAFIGQA